MDHLEYLKLEEELQSLLSLKSKYEALLSKINLDKEIDSFGEVGSFATPLVFNKEVFANLFSFSSNRFDVDYNKLLYQKQILGKGTNNFTSLWKFNYIKKSEDSVYNLEKIINKRIDSLYASIEDHFESLITSQDISNFETQSFFYDQVIISNDEYSDFFTNGYEGQFLFAISRLQRRINHFLRIKTLSFYIDKRFRLRQIIKFLFKNLDDSHSSLNNSLLNGVKDYLLKSNYNEKRKYKWAC
jgi:hypothetical protein